MDTIFEHLTREEKYAIMAVLSRDRRLREIEEERITKLRIELAKERRSGALVPGRDDRERRRACARCRETVGIVSMGRCSVCKHVVCKSCRIYKETATYSLMADDADSVSQQVDSLKGVANPRLEPSSAEFDYNVDASESKTINGSSERIRKHYINSFSNRSESSSSSRMHTITHSFQHQGHILPSPPSGKQQQMYTLPNSISSSDPAEIEEIESHVRLKATGSSLQPLPFSIAKNDDTYSDVPVEPSSFSKTKYSRSIADDESTPVFGRNTCPAEYTSDDCNYRRKCGEQEANFALVSGVSDGDSTRSASSGKLTVGHTQDIGIVQSLPLSKSTSYKDLIVEPAQIIFTPSSSGANLIHEIKKDKLLQHMHVDEPDEYRNTIIERKPSDAAPDPFTSMSHIKNSASGVIRKLEGIIHFNASTILSRRNTKENQKKSSSKRLYQMATQSNINPIALPMTMREEIVSAPMETKSNEAAILNRPDKSIQKEVPYDGALAGHDQRCNVIATEQAKTRVKQLGTNSRQRHHSHFRIRPTARRELFSDDSIPTEEDISYYRPDSSSSSGPRSTSSSDECCRYRHDEKLGVGRFERVERRFSISHGKMKDSGYSTHENVGGGRRQLRAARLTRRARKRERNMRRQGRRAHRQKYRRHETSRSSSPEIRAKHISFAEHCTASESMQLSSTPRRELHPKSNNLERPDVGNRGRSFSNGDVYRLKSPSFLSPVSGTKTVDYNSDSLKNIRTGGSYPLRDKAKTSAKKLFSALSNHIKMANASLNRSDHWMCRVCHKTLELKKKSGEWFHSLSRPEVLRFKETLMEAKRKHSKDSFTPLSRVESFVSKVPPPAESPITLITPHPADASFLTPPIRRGRSSTMPCIHLDPREREEAMASNSISRIPSSNSLNDRASVDLSQLSATRRRQMNRIWKKSVAAALHETLIFHIPESNAPAKPLKYLKKQSSMSETPAQPARIKNGPNDTAIVQGNAIHLSCTLTGTPPLKSVWRKGKNEIRHSDQCNIECTDTAAKLTILHSERDDSGCYILQVKNLAGVDQFSINVSVVDVPDAPGKPHASDINGDSLVLSWYGTGYDGGSTVTAYRVEKAEVNASGRLSDWSVAAHPSSTSCTVKKLKANSRYVFRVCAENKYGQSVPGDQSDIIINSTTEVADSSEDEESFFTHPAVEIRTDGTFSKKYETKEKLGQGRFGKVHRVIDRDSGKAYAAKIMRALKAKDKEAVQQEIDVMNSLRHPRLVQLIDAFSHGREITMVMDLVSGGELFERVIDEDFELTEAACIKYMRQICDGLKYMHDALILHLDLKPENIMCINKTGTQIKIIDFGLARRFNPREVIRVMFGTPEFVAPEVINYDAIGPQTDMWSVGVICYILLSGLSPFMGDNDSETLSNITAAEWDFDDESFDEISYEAKDFIRQLLVKPLSKRYDVHKALDHKWLKKDTNKMNKSKLNTKNLKRFLARRKWQKTGNAVRALGRLASLANLGSSSKNPNKIANGQPRESGFLAALKAQLLRENEEEQENHANCKPMFEQLFDDIEVIEGSAVKFECTIIGTPDPEIMWFKDGEPITESRHYRISYTEDDVCTLLITDATEADEAEYTCRAVNCEGETEHRAELIVITPGV